MFFYFRRGEVRTLPSGERMMCWLSESRIDADSIDFADFLLIFVSHQRSVVKRVYCLNQDLRDYGISMITNCL